MKFICLALYRRLRIQLSNKEGTGNDRWEGADKVSLHLFLHYPKLVLEVGPVNLG